MNAGEIGLKLLEALSPLLLAALTWGAAKLAQWISAKVKNEYLHGVLVRLDDAVFAVVKDVQRSVVDQIKAASADGRITDLERKQIKDQAIAAVRSYLGAKGLEVVAKVLGLDAGGIEKFLGSKIEAAVYDLRQAAPAMKPGLAVPAGSAPVAEIPSSQRPTPPMRP